MLKQKSNKDEDGLTYLLVERVRRPNVVDQKDNLINTQITLNSKFNFVKIKPFLLLNLSRHQTSLE